MPNFFNKIFLSIFIFILFICFLFVPIMYSNNSIYYNQYSNNFILSEDIFCWPIPGYTYISSYFGKRTSPTIGASTYHSGIDIPASNNTALYAVESGTITFASWGAGGGYTIVLDLENFSNISVSYCHTSPNYIVSKGDHVLKGELIGYVGPKNVYGINNNPYKDSNGNPTNRCNYRKSFTFNYKRKRNCSRPIKIFYY